MASNRILSLPGRVSTYFYFSKLGRDGFSQEQQSYIEGLISSYRKRFPRLEITGVWDFGMEEGTKYAGKKYGDFASCKDNAVFNIEMMSISYNHIRVSKMPLDISGDELKELLRRCGAVRELSGMAAGMREGLMNRGLPPAQILLEIDRAGREFLESRGAAASSFMGAGPLPCIDPGPHNHLPLWDPLFADVWAIRRLEETMSIRRLTVHELGHAISINYGILGLKAVKKLFSKCRDGFEDLDEFCAECFMAAELTDQIPLANSLLALIGQQGNL